jgi:hypothetical protein
MDPITLAALLSSIPPLMKGIFGMSQLNKAKRIEAQNPRPIAEVAPAINQMVGYTKGLSLASQAPGSEISRNQIGGATAAGMRVATQLGLGAEAYGAMNKMVASGQNAQAGLAQNDIQYANEGQNKYINSLATLGQEQNRVWGYNEADKYTQAAQMASELRTAGPQNMFSGASGIFGAAASAVAPDFNAALNSGKGYGGGKSNITLDDVKAATKGLKS